MSVGQAVGPAQVILHEHFLEDVRLHSNHLTWDPGQSPPNWFANYGYLWAHPPAPQGHVVVVKVEVELKSPLLRMRPVDLKFTLTGVFTADRALEHQEAEAFAHAHAVYLLWPYVQEATRTLSERAGGPPFILGPLPPPDAATP